MLRKVRYNPLGNAINAREFNYFPKTHYDTNYEMKLKELWKETGDSYEES